ncbi:hypothetical protein BD560DRAFT_447125 [Blakeslea trispora]|nr:hypothetical protein BD560DRAFT_447125 [Blakeslea trispora]
MQPKDEQSHILKLESLLECDVCNTALSEPRVLRLCDHILCLTCLKPLIESNHPCPVCQKPMSQMDLEPDQRLSNILLYVDQLKQQLMQQNLTPLEFSMVSKQPQEDMAVDTPLFEQALSDTSRKRTIADQQQQEEEEEEEDELESEFSDNLVSRKRLKPQFSEDDPMAFNSDPSVPGATLGLSSAEQTQESRLEDEEEEEQEKPRANTIAEASVVDDGHMTELKEQWQCTECQYENAPYIQTCGICHTFRANITPTTSIPQVEESQEKQASHQQPAYELTVTTDKENQAVHATQPTTEKRTKADTPLSKEAHILYTGLLPEDEKSLEKIKKEAEKSKLKIFIHYQMRDFHEITHVVTSVNKQRLCKRTMKYLQGILAGKWIVDPGWLLDSVKENEWQTEEHYQVQGDHLSGVTIAPAKGREHMHTPLFEHLSFYLNGEFSGKHNKNDLLILCRTGGAKIISRKPTAVDKNNKLVVIVPEGYKRKKTSAWLDAYPVKDPVWLIQCISTFEVDV